MSDPLDVYSDDAIARLYDHFNAWGPGDEFYLALAREAGGPVLDLGCGTGMAAVRIAAAAGLEVTGADPSLSMLAVARSREGTERVHWIHAAGQDLALAQRFALIYMTGHAFQALLTDGDAVAVLRNAGRHLAPGGRLAFDTRNPAVREWLTWNAREWREVRPIPELGLVEESGEAAHDSATGIVTIDHVYRFLDHGQERHARSRIRFIDQPHLARLIQQAGLQPTEYYGWWDRTPFGPESQEIIAVMGKAA
jgi:ubiquinone/menaquinone biosynthesis C-methylase UbiE